MSDNVTELPRTAIFKKAQQAAKDGKPTEQFIKEDLTQEEIAKLTRIVRITMRATLGVVALGAAAAATKVALDRFKNASADESENENDEI